MWPHTAAVTYSLRPPSFEHWLGTDVLGRSVAALLVEATFRSLASVAFAAVLAAVVGMFVGLLAVVTRSQSIRIFCHAARTLAFATPLLVVLLLFLSFLGDRPLIFPLVAGAFSWGGIAIAIESAVVDRLSADYVRAARAFGARAGWLARRHLIPNVLPEILAAVLGTLPFLVQLVVILSFLGVGSMEVGIGSLIKQGYDYFPTAWWLWLPSTVVVMGLLGGAESVSRHFFTRDDGMAS